MMLAYAANRPLAGKRQPSPNALLLIVSAHVALLAAVMSAKMDLPAPFHREPPIIIDSYKEPPPPPPVPMAAPRAPQPRTVPPIDDPTQVIKAPSVHPTSVQAYPDPNPGPVIGGGGVATMPFIPQPVVTSPIRHDPRLLTPMSELKPPYPASKLASEEEATLRLRVTIDDRGRVVAVDPVGYADREFLDAARRYMVAHWRYDPATEDGRPIATTTVVTLRFQLDG
jgi:periplasmic protein TonB